MADLLATEAADEADGLADLLATDAADEAEEESDLESDSAATEAADEAEEAEALDMSVDRLIVFREAKLTRR